MAGYEPSKVLCFVWPERLTAIKTAIRDKAAARDKAANGG
jgi:hypothetical protein